LRFSFGCDECRRLDAEYQTRHEPPLKPELKTLHLAGSGVFTFFLFANPLATKALLIETGYEEA
jgi:hypothetical protein